MAGSTGLATLDENGRDFGAFFKCDGAAGMERATTGGREGRWQFALQNNAVLFSLWVWRWRG